MTSRRLAAIMFADIVGYTAMMQRNEQEGLVKVRRFSEVIEQQVETHQGEVLQFMGDGCLCVFDSEVQAMHAAKHIQHSLQSEPEVPLRIGIHIGDIVRQEGNIYGDGVNLASRVESMGVPGSILVTEQVIHDVKSHPEFEMTSLGRFQFKNVEKPMEVFALANEGFVVPKLEEMKGKGEKQKTGKETRKLMYVGFVVLAIIVAVWTIVSLQRSDQIKQLEKSLVVLPFTNISDGITEDLLIQLSKVRSLKVISQTSAMRYKNSDKSLQQIANELNVNYVVRGSIRKQQKQVRISAQLVQAKEDMNLWADQYDFELSDVFAVQSQVAQTIAKALRSQISLEEKQKLEEQTHRKSGSLSTVSQRKIGDTGSKF